MQKITVQIDPDLADLIPGFLANRERDVAAILDLLDRRDFDAIRIRGHSMKGAGGGYGFDAITEIGARIEKAAIGRDADAIRGATDELRSYLQRVEVVFD